MADELITIQPPLAGLNLDTSPSQIDADETPELYNFLLHEPGQMRRRHGWKARFPMGTVKTSGSKPLNIMPCRNRFLAAWVASPATWYPQYFASSTTAALPAGYARTNGTIRIWAFNADVPGNWTRTEVVQNGTTIHTAMMPLSRTEQYEYAAYGASAQPILRLDKANVLTRTTTRLVKWGGSTAASSGDFATINNGSTDGVLTGTPPAYSLVDSFISFTADTPPYRYSYQVKTHVAGAADFTLHKPYGLGESTVNVPNKVASAINWTPLDVVINSPHWVQCVAVHYDRLFVGRVVTINAIGDIPKGEYPNAIAWSNVGEPEKWNDSNMILVDDRPDDMIMGFGHFGRNLAIFKVNSVYVLSGYSEETFTVFPLTKEFGCVDSRSIVQLDDGVAFMSRKGFMYIDGAGTITELSQREPGHGVKAVLVPEISDSLGTYSMQQHRTTSAALCQDYVLLTNQYNSTLNAPYESWMMSTKTRAWGRWGNDQAAAVPFVYSPANQYINGRVVCLFEHYVAELDNMFLPENQFTWSSDYKDQHYSAADAFTEPYIPVVCRTKDFRFWEGSTGRLRAMYVEHTIQYVDNQALDQNGLQVEVDTDRTLSTGSTTVGMVEPQFEDALVAPRFDYYYVREFRAGGFQKEGAVFRFRLSQEDAGGTYPHVLKWYNLRLLVERTNPVRIQNTVPF